MNIKKSHKRLAEVVNKSNINYEKLLKLVATL